MERVALDPLVLEHALDREPNCVGYHLGRVVSGIAAGRHVTEVYDPELDLWDLAREGFCELEPLPDVHAQVPVHWNGRSKTSNALRVGWSRARWDGEVFETVVLRWNVGFDRSVRHWILGRDAASGTRFVKAALDATHLPPRRVLVFGHSCFSRDKSLYDAVQESSWDELILHSEMAARLRSDVRQFLDSPELYRRYRVPHKRGMLLTGPPGNGKTHCVRVLVKEAALPCIYVKSFAARYGEEEANIAKVFERARKIAPCSLVLEDVDSLVRPHCLSPFLNEIDGLAADTGILTIATTNHPERLDPALLERPSRFDRKYHFPLPTAAERKRYFDWWNNRLEAEMKLEERTVETLCEKTESMSFAFLKELVVSSMTRWIQDRVPGALNALAIAEIDALRATWRPFDEGDVPRKTKKDEVDDD